MNTKIHATQHFEKKSFLLLKSMIFGRFIQKNDVFSKNLEILVSETKIINVIKF